MRQNKEVFGQVKIFENIAEPIYESRVDLPSYDDQIKKNPMVEPSLRGHDNTVKICEIIPDIDKTYLSKKYLAYIRTESLDFIRDNILKTEISNDDLVKKIVVFKHGTSIFLDKFDLNYFGGNDVIAMMNNISLDSYDCPFDTESYIYLANSTNNLEKIKNKHTVINKDFVKHPIYFKAKSAFFARHTDAIEVKISRFDKNEVVDRH